MEYIKRLADSIYVWVCVVVVPNDFSDCAINHWNPLRSEAKRWLVKKVKR